MTDFCGSNPGHHGLVAVTPKCKDTRSVHTSSRDTLSALENLLVHTAMSTLSSPELKHVAAQCLQVLGAPLTMQPP